jgi:hypothetical protein
MGEVIPFAKVLDGARRRLVRARATEREAAPTVRAADGVSGANQAACARYLEDVVNYFETGRPPAVAR